MALSELSRSQIIQRRRDEAEKSVSPAPALESTKKPIKMKEKSIFAEESEAVTDAE